MLRNVRIGHKNLKRSLTRIGHGGGDVKPLDKYFHMIPLWKSPIELPMELPVELASNGRFQWPPVAASPMKSTHGILHREPREIYDEGPPGPPPHTPRKTYFYLFLKSFGIFSYEY